MIVQTYTTEIEVSSLDELRSLVASSQKGPHGACLLFSSNEKSLFVYWNERVAALFFFDGPDDEVRSTVNSPFDVSDHNVVTFRIENGQVDEYPRAITCPKSTAMKGLEEFFVSSEKPKGITWFPN